MDNKNFLEKDFYKNVEVIGALKHVLYSDTDSIFIKIPTKNPESLTSTELWDTALKSANGINDLIIDYTKDVLLPRCNIDPIHNKTFFKTELLMESIIFLDVKKKYGYKLIIKEGNPLKVPKVCYTGIEVVKSNTPTLTQDLLKEIIEDIALNSKIPQDQRRQKTSECIDKFYNIFTECVNELKIDYIGIPGKWQKAKQVINGMKLYNFLMNENIFEPGSSAKFVYINNITIGNFKNINGICLPYEFNKDLIKEKFDIHKINIDINTHWSKLYNTTCQRVIDIIKST